LIFRNDWVRGLERYRIGILLDLFRFVGRAALVSWFQSCPIVMAKPTTDPIRIMLVDDSTLVRSGIRAVLSAHACDGGGLVGAGGRAPAQARCHPARHPPAGCLGLKDCRQILKELPDTQVLVLTSFSNDSLMAAGLFVYQSDLNLRAVARH
jgi:hypothetical protein